MPFTIGAPETANDPVRYDNSGTKMLSSALAVTGAKDSPATTVKAVPSNRRRNRICLPPFDLFGGMTACHFSTLARSRRPAPSRQGFGSDCASLIWERPHPQFLLGNLPQPREASWFRDQEEHDQRADDHELDVLNCCRVNWDAKLRRKIAKRDRHNEDQGGAEKRAGQTPKSSNDNHEENEEAQIDIENRRLRAPVPEENQQRTRNAAVERRRRKCQKFGLQQTYSGEFSREIHVSHCHPHASDPAVHQVRCKPGHHNDETEHHKITRRVGRGRTGDWYAEQGARRDLNRAGRIVVIKPGLPNKTPGQKKLCGQRCHRQIKSLDPQRRQSEQNADRRREKP